MLSPMNENRRVLTSEGYPASRWLPQPSLKAHPTPEHEPPPTEAARAWREADAVHLVELMTACSYGQEEALAELYDLTSSRIYGMVLRVVPSTDLAAEITQEVYVEVWRQSARYLPGNGSVLRWMMAMAHRTSVDRVRLATI